MSVAATQFTPLLGNDVLARVERMRLNPLRRRTNRMRGEHLSGKGGTSIEFRDYRNYVSGDDIRYVDWNIFARLNEPYLKLFAHEEESQVVILLDASTSMGFENKFDLARQIGSCLGVMGLMSVEKVSIYSCGAKQSGPMRLLPCSGRASLKKFFRFMEQLEPGGDFPIEEAIESVLQHHRGRGIAVVLSDFLTLGSISRSFNLLHGAGLELYAMQVLSPSEIDPEMTGDLRFIDSENDMTLDVSSVGELLGIYHEHRLGLERHLEIEARKRNGRFAALSSAMTIKEVMFDTLLRRGWVR